MDYLLKNGFLIDGIGRTASRSSVLIQNGKIQAVGENLISKQKTEIVDLKGKTIMPGLIDLHNHLVGGDKAQGHGDEGAVFRMDEPLAMAAFRTVNAAKKTLQVGVTTIREIGGRDFVSVHFREAVGLGFLTGPRVVSAGVGIAPTGGHGSFWRHEVDGCDAIMKEVRQQVKMGVDWIKLVGVDGPESTGDWKTEQFTFDEIKTAVQTAKMHKRGVAAHAMGPPGIKNAVKAGVDTIEHGWFIDGEACKLMVQKGTCLVTTQMCAHCVIKSGTAFGMPWADMFAPKESEIRENFQNAIKRGVTIALGTDCGGNEATLHGTNTLELQLYVENGMTEMQAIVAATSTPAKVLKMDREIGTILPGKHADMIVIDGNPLEDIRVLQNRVSMVFAGGKLVWKDNYN